MENAATRICREASGRVTTNVIIRDLDLVGPHVDNGRKLEVVADGLPLMGSAQLAETQRWSVPCGLTGCPGEKLRSRMEWPANQLANAT